MINLMLYADSQQPVELAQAIYAPPIKEKLITKRIGEIKAAGVPAIVSSIPLMAERFGKIAQEAGCDIFVVQATVTTTKHISSAYKTLDFYKFCKMMKPISLPDMNQMVISRNLSN